MDTINPWVEGQTIGAVLRQSAAKAGAREALVFPQHAFRLSYRDLDRDVDRVARGLLALGLERGDHLAVWSTNHPQWVLLQFATARVGVVLVTVNPAYRARELAYVLRQSDAKVLALIDSYKGTRYFDVFACACAEMAPAPVTSADSHCQRETEPATTGPYPAFPRLQTVLALSGTASAEMVSWADFLARCEEVSSEALTERSATLTPADPINLQYTSGTTGFPKGALLSHRNLLLNAFYAGEAQHFTGDDRLCIPVPLYHCFGCVLGTLCCMVYGATMVFPHEYFQPGPTLDALEQERCTAIYGVPTMFIAQLEHPSYEERAFPALRTGIMAGSPCPIELMKKVTTKMGARELTIGYGQTEASPLITQTRAEDSLELRVGTVGKPIPGVEVKIIDPITGVECPDGVSGELCARGHMVMMGYYHMPEATAKAIDAHGWLHTGDLAARLPNGYFRITGRHKDMIIRGGENISPREIEEILYQHHEVEEVQVVGVPDNKFGEEILAWIKRRPDATCSADDLRAFCRARLAHFKTPRYIQFVESFPMTVTGKIQKFKIREQAIQDLGLQDVANVETA